jgi:thiamine pyridinylase
MGSRHDPITRYAEVHAVPIAWVRNNEYDFEEGVMMSTRCFAALALLAPLSANAGELVIRNVSPSAVVCHADGYTSATGWPVTWDITVQPGENVRLEPNYKHPNNVVIDWAECGGLQTRAMNVTPQRPDSLILFTGKQTRVLNVALYPDIPSHPNGNFSNLLDHVVNAFQALNPDVLLNAVMADEDAIYSFKDLPPLLGPSGYDVIELDTLYLGFLASRDLITPAKIVGDAPWPVALAASTVADVLYGVPSWLCMDFIFSFSPSLKSVHTLNDLLRFEANSPKSKPALLADYDGSWRLPSIYINAYVQTYGYQNIAKAFVMPADPTVIANLESIVATCELELANPCVDGTNHGQPDGAIERVFANGNAGSDMGFSEQSFYVVLNQSIAGNLTIIPATWGEKPQPLLYSDTFVTNKSTCSSAPCQGDSAAFTSLMTGSDMKSYIAFSHDLSPDMPPRHLLVATQPFWDLAEVKNDPIYRQVAAVVQTGQPFPNDFTEQQQLGMDAKICAALKADVPNYNCKSQFLAAGRTPNPSSSPRREPQSRPLY